MKNLKKRNDFLSIKESINNNTLEKLASEISSAETEDGFAKFDITEFNIDGILFFVTGTVEYIEKQLKGDYYNEPSSDRMFFNADLQILWNDGTMEEDISLKKEEIDFIIKQLNKYN